MAIEKKTSSERPVDPIPKRSETTQKRSSVARKRAVVGGIGALALVGGGAFFMTRAADGVLPFFPTDKPPALSFEVTKVGIETTTTTRTKDVKDVAQGAADQVKTQLESLYYNAFIDPHTWGDPGELDKLFTEDAMAQVENENDTLTLGANASDVYDYVTPEKSKLQVKVLTDGEDKPAQAMATVTFAATAEHDDGTFTRIASDGSYFLKQVDGEWRIFAFDVTRNEKDTEAPGASDTASASPEGSKSAEASP